MQPDELAAYLDELRHDDCFRVDERLKVSASEETQRVYFIGANGAEQGPYIRKYINRSSGLGTVYRDLYAARCQGRRFRYLPAVYACVQQPDCLVILMEYAAGCTLRELVERTNPTDRIALASQVLPALCDAATELHEGLATPIVHRDLTPSNILCPPDAPANLTVIDMGISRRYAPGASVDTAYFGTRAYAPPEQFGFGQTDQRTDIYAVAMTAFYCLTGRDPTAADRKRGFKDPGIPEPLRAVIARGASLDAGKRYTSARDMREALVDAFASLGPDDANPPQPTSSGGETLRRWGIAWNVIVLLAYGVLLAACISIVVDPGPKNIDWPLPTRLYAYLGFMNINLLEITYLLLDRRRMDWRRRLWGQHPVRHEVRWLLGIAMVNWVAFGIATAIPGAWGTAGS